MLVVHFAGYDFGDEDEWGEESLTDDANTTLTEGVSPGTSSTSAATVVAKSIGTLSGTVISFCLPLSLDCGAEMQLNRSIVSSRSFSGVDKWPRRERNEGRSSSDAATDLKTRVETFSKSPTGTCSASSAGLKSFCFRFVHIFCTWLTS